MPLRLIIPEGRVLVGGVPDEPTYDVIVRERGGWSVYSETRPRKRLGGPYQSKAQAHKRLGQVEYFKAKEKDAALYTPPPGQGTAPPGKNHPNAPATTAFSAPDPNTRPMSVSSGRADAKRPRLPPQIPPTRIEEEYAKRLIAIVKRATDAWRPVIRALPDLMTQAAQARHDAGESGKLKRLIDHAVATARAAVQPTEVAALARKFAKQTASYQRGQLTKQVRAALGADPLLHDKGLAERTDQFVHENVALVTRIPERLHGDLHAMVMRSVSSGRIASSRGGGPGTLQREIQDRFGVAERHARLVARDQTSKYYAAVNHARQREMGVTRFTWNTAGDERVRPEHAELDGREFDYDDPPEGDNGPVLPGEDIQCRCYASPVLDFDDD